MILIIRFLVSKDNVASTRVTMARKPRGRYGVFNPHTYGVFTPHTIRLVGMSNVPKGDCVVEGDRTYECRQTEGRRRPGVVLHEFVLLQRPSKFIRLGAKQIISSSTTDKLPTTAFLNLDGKIAVVVLNLTDQDLQAADETQPSSVKVERDWRRCSASMIASRRRTSSATVALTMR